MLAADDGHPDIVIMLLKAKADINLKNYVRVGLAGWMVVVCVCAEVEHPLGLSALEPRWRCRGRVVAASAMPMSFRQSRRYRVGRMRCGMRKKGVTAMLPQCSSRYWVSVMVSDCVCVL